jgi:hypothetical protein
MPEVRSEVRCSRNKGEKGAGRLRSPNRTTVVVIRIQGHRASYTHAFPGGVDS